MTVHPTEEKLPQYIHRRLQDESIFKIPVGSRLRRTLALDYMIAVMMDKLNQRSLRVRKTDEVLADMGAAILVIVGRTKMSVSAMLA